MSFAQESFKLLHSNFEHKKNRKIPSQLIIQLIKKNPLRFPSSNFRPKSHEGGKNGKWKPRKNSSAARGELSPAKTESRASFCAPTKTTWWKWEHQQRSVPEDDDDDDNTGTSNHREAALPQCATEQAPRKAESVK